MLLIKSDASLAVRDVIGGVGGHARNVFVEAHLEKGQYLLIVERASKDPDTDYEMSSYASNLTRIAQIEVSNPAIEQRIVRDALVALAKAPEASEITKYLPKEPNILKYSGKQHGLIYFYYKNASRNDNLSETLTLKSSGLQLVVPAKASNPQEIDVNVKPGEDFLVVYSVQDSSWKYEVACSYMILKDFNNEEDLIDEMEREKHKVTQREVEGAQIDVFVNEYFYSNGAAILYTNKTNKVYKESIQFELKNLKIISTNTDNAVEISLKPGNRFLVWMKKEDPGQTCQVSSSFTYSLE
jgi:hypothetical protein